MSIDACGACMSTIGGVCDKHSKNSINKTMDKKQQFIEKSLNKILTSKYTIALALALPMEVYDDFIKEIAKVIHLQLSECWDMAGEALEPKLAKLLLPEAVSDNDERNKTFAFGYNSASKEVNKKIRKLIDSLTSQEDVIVVKRKLLKLVNKYTTSCGWRNR